MRFGVGVPDWLVEGTMEKAQRDALESALEACRFNIGAAAARLRVGRSTVYRLLTKYEIAIPARPQRNQRPLEQQLSVAKFSERSASRIVIHEGKLYIVKDGAGAPPQ